MPNEKPATPQVRGVTGKGSAWSEDQVPQEVDEPHHHADDAEADGRPTQDAHEEQLPVLLGHLDLRLEHRLDHGAEATAGSLLGRAGARLAEEATEAGIEGVYGAERCVFEQISTAVHALAGDHDSGDDAGEHEGEASEEQHGNASMYDDPQGADTLIIYYQIY